MAPLKVCVIGGGPGAMFLCHAYNKQRREAQATAAGSASSTGTSPLFQELEITCMEQHSMPGGLWRIHSDDVQAYEELWTNGCCYSLEFYDYPFHQHFFNGCEERAKVSNGGGIPVYLPRQDVSEYITQRVTQSTPSFFDDYFEFNTKVLKVEEVDAAASSSLSSLFRVTTQHLVTLEITTRLFDKCVWAAGENSKGSIPASIRALFDTANAQLQLQLEQQAQPQEQQPLSATVTTAPRHPFCVLHSTDTKQIRSNVTGRKILLIGGGFSAEDLALQCLKWGATHVDVLARSDDVEVTWTSQWPGPDKVRVHTNRSIRTVDPTDGSIVLHPVEFKWPHEYVWINEDDYDDDEEIPTPTTLHDVETVIFCTGYQANLSMLDESLRPSCGRIPAWFMGTDPSLDMSDLRPLLDESSEWWTLKQQKRETTEADSSGSRKDDASPSCERPNLPAFTKQMLRVNYNHPDMHRGIFFKNPNLMFLCEQGSDVPLLSLDVHAWLLCSYLTGKIPLPTVPELIQANHQQVVDQMDLPFVRYYFDQGYFEAMEECDEYWDCPSPSSDDDEEERRIGGGYEQDEKDYHLYQLRLLAKVMQEGQYPGKSFGTYQELSEYGQAIINFGEHDYNMRADLSTNYGEEGHEWRTFRDDVYEPPYMYSLYTGHVARPLKQRWMDIKSVPSIKDGATTAFVGPVSVKRGDV